MSKTPVNIIASDTSWIEGEATRQLHQTASLPGIERAVGLPDLHPGKGIPVGAAFYATSHIYPHLVGNDIGCGMGLWCTDLSTHRFKLDKMVKQLDGLEDPWEGDAQARLNEAGIASDYPPLALGTIGGGNHFAELQKLEQIYDEDGFAKACCDASTIHLLVHSGSRGIGEAILRRHVEHYGSAGLEVGSDAFTDYLLAHDRAVRWAEVNREVIAERVLARIGGRATRLLDICHNAVTPYRDGWLHRKGAAPADKGFVVIPGSRGTLTYLVEPLTALAGEALHSLAHGAGRKWQRSDAKAKLERRYKVNDLTRTPLGGRVICEDKALIYEEAPEAYKKIEQVIEDLRGADLIRLIASFRPLITYKTRRK